LGTFAAALLLLIRVTASALGRGARYGIHFMPAATVVRLTYCITGVNGMPTAD
jgi:hypothetical protein